MKAKQWVQRMMALVVIFLKLSFFALLLLYVHDVGAILGLCWLLTASRFFF